MAQTGLRMMPTSPSPPLKFRTAGFPRYGFKASLSGRAFPNASAVKPAPGIPVCAPGLHRPFARFHDGRADPALCPDPAVLPRAAVREARGLPTPGVLGSGPSSVVSVHRRVLRPHPPVSQARGDFTALPLIRRAFAVRERLGDPRDLPYFPCRAVHACRRPYAGGSAAPSRCAGTAMPGFLVLSASRHPRGPVSASNFRRGLRFRRCIVRVMLRPACLPGPPGWLGRDATICLAPRRLRTVSLPLLTASVAGRRWESG